MSSEAANDQPLVECGVKRKRDEADCVMCSSIDIKYRCPKCERITCSLNCCLEHKKHYDCDGKRDRTKFIPLTDFHDADITSDYFFLQEIARSTSTINDLVKQTAPKGGHKKQKSKANPELPSNWLARFPAHWQNFVKQAKKQGVDVSLLAPGMSKRNANTSSFHGSVISWRIELHFINLTPPVKLVQSRWNEEKTLNDFLDDALAIRLENANIRSQLKTYIKHDRSNWLFLLRKEFVSASTPQYYVIAPEKSLSENFRGISIVEFPIIHVVLQQDSHKYALAHRSIEEVSPALIQEIN